MPDTDEQVALRRAAEVLGSAEEVALACHLNPDADALGSMLGLSNFLRARGVTTVCSFANEPFDLPRWITLLPGADRLVPPAEFPAAPGVMVTCDCASFDRLGVLGDAATKAGELIWIDHHRSNDGFGTVRLVDPDASSTCEMVFRLIEAMGGELRRRRRRLPLRRAGDGHRAVPVPGDDARRRSGSPPASGSTTSTTRRSCARCTRTTIPGSSACSARRSARMTEVPEASVVWTYLTQADLAEAGVGPGDTDDVIDVLRTARDVDVAAVLKQQRDGRFKVSVRSRGGHDLSAVASAFGGGGHRLAAGYTSEHGPEGTIERLVAALRQAPVPS